MTLKITHAVTAPAAAALLLLLTPTPTLTLTLALTRTPPLLLLLPRPHRLSPMKRYRPWVRLPLFVPYVVRAKTNNNKKNTNKERCFDGSEWVAPAAPVERVALAGGMEKRARRQQ